MVKIIDSAKKQITIKAKEYTLTDDVIDATIHYSELSRKLNYEMEKSLPSYRESTSGAYVVSLSDIPLPGFDTDNEYANKLYELEQEFEGYLLNLPIETITDIMTLMYIGRGQDADMSLPPLERFLDYWVYLSDSGCFSAPTNALVSQITDKAPLAEYLRQGRDLLKQPIREKSSPEDEECGGY